MRWHGPPCDDRGTVVVDGFAVYEVLARDGLGLVLAHCWAHTKRKYEESPINGRSHVQKSARSLVSSTRSNVSCRDHSRRCLGTEAASATAKGATASDPRSHLAMGHGPSRSCRGAISGSGALHAQALGGPHAIRRGSAHPARQQCGAPRPRRRPQESLWVGSLRGTEVAAALYTLCETARLVGADPRAYLLRAVYAAIGRPGTVTFPEDLLASTLTG